MIIPPKLGIFRDRNKTDSLCDEFKRKGIEGVGFPLFEYSPIAINEDSIFRQLQIYKNLKATPYLLFTSAYSVKVFVEIFNKKKEVFSLDYPILSIGPATTHILKSHSFKIIYEAKTYSQKGVWNLIKDKSFQPILFFRAILVNPFLEKKLIDNHINFFSYPLYKTNDLKLNKKQKEEILKLDYLLFTSSTTVDNFFNNFSSMNIDLQNRLPKIINIGENTHKKLQEHFKVRKIDQTLQNGKLVEEVLKIINK